MHHGLRKSEASRETIELSILEIMLTFVPTSTMSCLAFGAVMSSEIARKLFGYPRTMIRATYKDSLWPLHVRKIGAWARCPDQASHAITAAECGSHPRYIEAYRRIFGDVKRKLRSGSVQHFGSNRFATFCTDISKNELLAQVVRLNQPSRSHWICYMSRSIEHLKDALDHDICPFSTVDQLLEYDPKSARWLQALRIRDRNQILWLEHVYLPLRRTLGACPVDSLLTQVVNTHSRERPLKLITDLGKLFDRCSLADRDLLQIDLRTVTQLNDRLRQHHPTLVTEIWAYYLKVSSNGARRSVRLACAQGSVAKK